MKSLELRMYTDTGPVCIVAHFENNTGCSIPVESERKAHSLGIELRKGNPASSQAALEIVRAWRKGQPVQYEVIE